jgi:SAM-dependent methyltransferase
MSEPGPSPLSPAALATLEQQRLANASGVEHFAHFDGHREQTTRLVTAPPRHGAETLCVLGAGNAQDLELERLFERFAWVHLVDIDPEALARARARLTEPLEPRLVLHAPVDLSGLFHDIERFRRLQVTADDLVRAPAAGARRIASALPGPFDVVASTCLLTQLQLSLLSLLGENHRLFVVLRELLSLTHLRTLAALCRPGGHAVLITDLCELAPNDASLPADLTLHMAEVVSKGQVVHSAHPTLIEHAVKSDPVLCRAFGAAQPSAPWLWKNGPERRFLVYGFTLPRLA